MFCKATGTVVEWWLDTLGDCAEDDGLEYCDSKSPQCQPNRKTVVTFFQIRGRIQESDGFRLS